LSLRRWRGSRCESSVTGESSRLREPRKGEVNGKKEGTANSLNDLWWLFLLKGPSAVCGVLGEREGSVNRVHLLQMATGPIACQLNGKIPESATDRERILEVWGFYGGWGDLLVR